VSDDDDESDSEPVVPESDFSLHCKRALQNCISRGRRYFQSGRVLTVQDCVRSPHYFLKNQVQASMELDLRDVTATLEYSTGDIRTASCSCKPKALNRCGHIAAVFVLVLDHMKTAGHEGAYRFFFHLLFRIKTTTGKDGRMISFRFPTDRFPQIQFLPSSEPASP